MFQGISIREFNKTFQTDDDCRQYLFDMKWQAGYTCQRCGHDKSNKGKTHFHLRCKQCGYDESVTANTIFHKIKFPLLKAFGMVFRTSVRKKGMSTLELAREFSVNKKTSWLFKRKTQEAMKDSGDHPLEGKIEVAEVLISGCDTRKGGQNKGYKKRVVIAIEKVKNHKLGRARVEVVEQASDTSFSSFFDGPIDSDKTIVQTLRRSGY